jgi:hypothetical protein
MIVRRDCSTFKVLGQEVHLYSEELPQGRSTVAEIDVRLHYMGHEIPNVATAIFAWQEVNGRDLTTEEFRQVMLDNNIISQAV